MEAYKRILKKSKDNKCAWTNKIKHITNIMTHQIYRSLQLFFNAIILRSQVNYVVMLR